MTPATRRDALARCPIVWKKEDGPHPCAFVDIAGKCTSQLDAVCIPLYHSRYMRAVSLVPGGNPCPECGKITNITYEQLDRGQYPLCKKCVDEYCDYVNLAAHIRGDC